MSPDPRMATNGPASSEDHHRESYNPIRNDAGKRSFVENISRPHGHGSQPSSYPNRQHAGGIGGGNNIGSQQNAGGRRGPYNSNINSSNGNSRGYNTTAGGGMRGGGMGSSSGYGTGGGGYGGGSMGGSMYGMGMGMGMMGGMFPMMSGMLGNGLISRLYSLQYTVQSVTYMWHMAQMNSHVIVQAYHDSLERFNAVVMAIRTSEFRRVIQRKCRKSQLLRFLFVLASSALCAAAVKLLQHYLKMPRNDMLTNGTSGYNSGGVNMGMYGGAAVAGAAAAAAARLQQAPGSAAAPAGAHGVAPPSSVAAPARE